MYTLILTYILFQFITDNLFPIDLSTVAKDHPFLENDPLQSLYRRLVILNKCAKIRVDLQKKTPASSVVS